MLALAPAPALTGCGGGDEPPAPPPQERDLRVEVVATGLEVPWEIAFMPDGRALVTERPGRVRLLDADLRLRDEPVAEVAVSAQGEGGLLGLALDPAFSENQLVYLYFTTAEGMKLERRRFEDDRLRFEATLLEGIAAGAIHDSGRIAFGPDDMLYVATGDAGDGTLAQDDASLNGKFLRVDRSGGEPEVVSKGHRNPQGFDWEPGGERLISTEHGPVGFDEINAIVQGGNYGWPDAVGEDHGDGFIAPLHVYVESVAPSGATFVTREGSRWTGDFLFATLRGEALRRLRLEGDKVVADEALLQSRYGRLRTVVEGPDGALYVLTSNRDGRGGPVAEDDRILRVTPPSGTG